MKTVGTSSQNGNASLTISSDVHTLANTELNSTAGSARFFPFVQNDTLTNYDVSGAANGQLNRTQSTNYTYDNYGNATNVQTTVTDNDPSSPYHGDVWVTSTTNTPDVDTTNWCLRLITQSIVSYSATSDAAVTRTRQYTPNTVACRYSGIVTEPNNPSYMVSESFGFDNFGGTLIPDTVTAASITWRRESHPLTGGQPGNFRCP